MLTNEERAIWSGLKEGRPIYPDYPHDLAACFRDFEPKLRGKSKENISINFAYTKWGDENEVLTCTISKMDWILFTGWLIGDAISTGKGNTYSEAFTNAVDKIIEERK